MNEGHTPSSSGAEGRPSSPIVLLLDDDRDVLETFVNAFDAVGAPSLAVQTVEELRRHASEALACKVAILDINLGSESGLDALAWLREISFRGRIVFLTGHAESNPQVQEAERTGIRVMQKPTLLDDLYALLETETGT